MVIEDGPYTIEVPKDKEGTFPIYLGLYNQEGRVTLGNGRDSFLVGKLEVRRENDRVRVEFKEEAGEDLMEKYLARLNKEGKSIDFGRVVTDGCLRIEKRGNSLRIIPIPIGRECSIGLRLKQFKKDWGKVKIKAFGEDGKELGDIEWRREGDLFLFKTRKDAQFYEVFSPE
jgi:hypothetical protein